MKRALCAVLTAALVIGVPAALGRPNASSISVGISQRTVVFGWSTTISGRVGGNKAPGAAVMLQAKPYGSTVYTTVQATFATSSGSYTFNYFPSGSATLRTVGATTPTATSPGVFVGVRPGVGLYVSTVRPKKGQMVGFAGQVDPAFNGMSVRLQRRTFFGDWITLALATLSAATSGAHGPRSQYSKRLQINKFGTYRVRFSAPKGWVSSISRTRTLRVH
jgi:hypothetical protein